MGGLKSKRNRFGWTVKRWVCQEFYVTSPHEMTLEGVGVAATEKGPHSETTEREIIQEVGIKRRK